ncbi:DsbA family protein [Corynebacterium sanguinis]|uniref:DsbA family oxidoreductase n=1 Tax=Corynebacterium sanguinis TaxID=2594913 RepID=UPI0021A71C5D|nr:DsbA family protein [Corynebacterium sanguinis]MCT2253034.1 DsbA family protein [Corynebacterium sanguinis]
MSTPTIDVYVDYVCPFCFLVEPAIEELKRDRDVRVRVRPFELRPDPVPTLRPEDDYLPRVWRDAVYPMAERVGVPVRLPSVSPQPRTEKAFLVLQLAQEQGLAEDYSRAMFAAFFQEDRDIGDEDVIVDIAETLGMDAASVRQAMSSPERLRQHRADLAHATETVGVTAVPGIVVNGTLLQGVPSATRLKKSVDAVSTSGGSDG